MDDQFTADSAAEIHALRRHLDELATPGFDEASDRYLPRWPRMPPGLYWQLRWFAGMSLRLLESAGLLRPARWPASLKHSGKGRKAGALLIWGVGLDRDTLRNACEGFSRVLHDLPEYAPVLVTDVADFAFFSRLGWQVEYLPRIVGSGEAYHERKARFLARLYRKAPALPASVGLMVGLQADIVRRLLAGVPA